jgi:hypothetical protein
MLPPLQEIASQTKAVKIATLNQWLDKHNDFMLTAIKETRCDKWRVFINDGEKPNHCFCDKREEMCLFLEVYFEITHLLKLHGKEPIYQKLISECQEIMLLDSKKKLKAWFQNYDSNHTVKHIDIDLQFLTSVEPFNTLKIRIDRTDFKYLFEYYSTYNELWRRIKYKRKYFKNP